MTSQIRTRTPVDGPALQVQGGLFRPLLVVFFALSVVTGLLYPGLVTGIASTVFPHQAAGSPILSDGKLLGSELIGQPFSDPKYVWGRPSATAPMPYNAAASGGSNLGPTNPAQTEAVRARVDALRAADPGNTQAVPVDLVTASGSGLDPHVSPAAAQYQAARVARERGVAEDTVRHLIGEHTEHSSLGVLGDPGVNVLKLNLALDALDRNARR